MSFEAYMKKEIEKAVFIEINRDISLDMKGNPILKKGEYPLIPTDVMHVAKEGIDGIPVPSLINGMIYLVGCDKSFVYNNKYIEFLKSIDEIKSYIIMQIEKNIKEDVKKSVVFVNALSNIEPSEQNMYNRVLILKEFYEKTSLDFIKEEILASLDRIINAYPEYIPAHFELGQYYLDKNMDMAKIHLRKCLDDKRLSSEAYDLLDKIRVIENYDKAVELVKEGLGAKALEILLPYIVDNPENPDAIYYVAVALRQIEEFDKALFYLNKLSIYGERPEILSEIALNMASLNDFEGALEYFKKSLKLMPDNSDTVCNIGACYLNLGEIDEARKTFELASRLNPKDDVAKKWIDYMNQNMQSKNL